MSTTSKKKPEPKKQEPPAEREPTEPKVMEEALTSLREGEGSAEPDLPMAAPSPSLEDRVAALEKAMIKVDDFCTRHNRYHFGGTSE